MLQPTSRKAALCYERAAEAKRKADSTACPSEQSDLLEMEARWLKLAESYELSERITKFLDYVDLQKLSRTCGFCCGRLSLKSAEPLRAFEGMENHTYECVECKRTCAFTVDVKA